MIHTAINFHAVYVTVAPLIRAEAGSGTESVIGPGQGGGGQQEPQQDTKEVAAASAAVTAVDTSAVWSISGTERD